MTEKMRKFLAILEMDETFQTEQEQLENMSEEEVFEWLKARAAKEGIYLTDEDFTLAKELSNEELKALSGGIVVAKKKPAECCCTLLGEGYDYSDGFEHRVCYCQSWGEGNFFDGGPPMRCAPSGIRSELWR